MSPPTVSRRARARVGLAVLAIGVTAAVALGEMLAHPLPTQPTARPGAERATPQAPVAAADPRAASPCPQDAPREGEPRGGAGPTQRRPPRVSSDELYNCPQAFNGESIRYRGEVVGDVLARDGGAWVQLNDGPYAAVGTQSPARPSLRGGNTGVGVFVPRELARAITAAGGPETRGDIVEVVGEFNRVDPATAETAVIRAESGRVVSRGRALGDPGLDGRALAVGVVAPLALATVALRGWRARSV